MKFYFPKRGSYEFFDTLGNRPEDYGVGFEKILNKKYLMSFKQLQQSTSNVYGLYCAYYVMKRNGRLVVTKMMTLFKQRRGV